MPRERKKKEETEATETPVEAPAEEKPKRSRKKAEEPTPEAAPEAVAEAEVAAEPETEPAEAQLEAEEPAVAEAAAAEATPEAPAPAPPARKKKRKRDPRSERRRRPKPKRVTSADARTPIVRQPKPEHERGRTQERRGLVVSSAMDKTIVVRVDSLKIHPVYKKVIRRSAKFHAHDERNAANVGDVVRIVEARPLSKTKRWRLAEILEVAK